MKTTLTKIIILISVFGLFPVNFSNAEETATRLKGRILLQVESRGEAWYVNPENEKRYYLGRPADAFQIMRDLGLGISNKDFDSFNEKAPVRLSGKILLKVEDGGKAYYINPLNSKLHYLGKPDDAFQIMRKLGLGIKNIDIDKISIKEGIQTIIKSDNTSNSAQATPTEEKNNNISVQNETQTNSNESPTETSQKTTINNDTPTSQSTQQSSTVSVIISNVNTVFDTTTGKISWKTSQPTESKLYLSGGGMNSKLFSSEAGYATLHFVTITQLTPMADYSFQITAIGNAGFVNYSGGFKTKTPSPTLKFNQSSQNIALGTLGFKISWTTTYVNSCSATGTWSGSKPANSNESLLFDQAGSFLYTLTCNGYNGENITKEITLTVIDTKPKFYFNDILGNLFQGKTGDSVKLSWESGYTSSCEASGSWSGGKNTSGSQNLSLDLVGEFTYTLTCINKYSGANEINTARINVSQ